ncbi:response regulator [Roseibium sp. Sym1]|uniref:response regulator n=1 Tax=Roseibium sp. Sym1 TaxID=3016006 RepID=UPI0022B3C1CE|nr:response regulator transcription factor [Roseibium sp. Sym1]
MRVLLIEDDAILGEAIRDHVVMQGHGVDWVTRLDEASLAIDAVPYELLLLDLNLPDGLGLTFLKTLRKTGNEVPVIVVTAQDQVAMRIEGLDSGADDYLVKPFDLAELRARLSAVARRYAGTPNPEVRIGDVTVDLTRKRAERGGRPVDLTAREWAVLERLLRHRGSIVSKPDIEESLYAFGAEVESNTVEVYVSRLRKKIGAGAITTVRGLGYKADA